MAPSSFRSLLGIPPSTASPSNSALLIVDAQNEYKKGALAVTNAEASEKVIVSLLEKYRAANGKIVHILHQTPEGAPIFTPNTELAEEFASLKPKVCTPVLFVKRHTTDDECIGWGGSDLEAVAGSILANPSR
jgi:nicotinamidase-related amidase